MTDTPPKPEKKRNWMKIVLVGSLAMNLLVVGVVAGALIRGPHDHDRNPALRELGFGPFVRAMSGADQKTLLDAIKSKGKPGRDNRAEMRANFQEILVALRAESFDAVAFAELIERTRSGAHNRQAEAQGALLDQIEGMDVETRKEYADQLEKMLKRGGPKRR